MNKGRNRLWFRLGILLVAGLLGVLWAGRGWSKTFLTVENESGQPIAQLRITIAGETETFREVPAHSKQSTTLNVRQGERFTVEGRLADGTMVRGSGLLQGTASLVVQRGGQIVFQPSGPASRF